MPIISDLMDFDLGRDGVSTGGFYNQLGRTIGDSGASSSSGGFAEGNAVGSVGISFCEDAFNAADDWVSPVFNWFYGLCDWVPTWVLNSARACSSGALCLAACEWFSSLWLVAIAGLLGLFVFQIIDASIRIPLMLLVASLWCAWQVCVVLPICLLAATLAFAFGLCTSAFVLAAVGGVIWCLVQLLPFVS